tara:strand:+ start:335 stop:529 length:195 start_codon:yes stop_codon:yes gene_type:complete
MTTYTCSVGCGMKVTGLTCGTCGKELVHDTISKDDGSSVHIAKCPDNCGKIKSPMCCGSDMANS